MKIESSGKFAKVLSTFLKEESFLKNDLFRIPAIRDALTLDRFQHLFDAEIKQSHSDLSSGVTIEHNTDIERMFFADLSNRPDLISNVLTSLNEVRQNASRMRVLSVGARTEAEIFSLVNAGFRLPNIECIDLFSYSPLIKIGDIHNIQYPNDSFDIVLCGWVLEFCSDFEAACEELKRVCKPNGYIAIGGMHHPSSIDLTEYNRRKHHEDRVWYCSIDNIKRSFSVSDADFVFKSDIEERDLDKRGDVLAIFKPNMPHV